MAERNRTSEETKEERTAEKAAMGDELWSWGAGTDGQLGTGRLEDEYLPQLLHLPSLSIAGPISMLACGGAHVIALTTGGKVLTWGRGTSGQLGHGDILNSLSPKLVSLFDCYTITHVAAGWSHSGFASDSGCLFTCGDGSFGQLGHGDYRSQCSPVKVSYFLNKHVQQVACGMRHSLVLLADCSRNQVYGFGSGKRGQLGMSSDRIKSVNLPQVTYGFGEIEVASISANGDHSAALSSDGHLFTWGRGFSGNPDAQCPQPLRSSLFVKEAALGWNHALILTGGGEVFMLGATLHGVLSDTEKPNRAKCLSDVREALLEKVPNLDEVKVVKIASGAEHSALITESGEIRTWGWGEHGQLGLGNICDQTNPQVVNLRHEHWNVKETRVYCGSGFTYAIIRRHQLPS